MYFRLHEPHLELPLRRLSPLDAVPEDDRVLHEGEEDEHHAGQQPDLQRRHRVGHRDLGAAAGHSSDSGAQRSDSFLSAAKLRYWLLALHI